MTSTRRRSLRRLWVCARVGLLTWLAVYLQISGRLTRIEHVLYDQRVARCQHFMPPPTDRLVHLDIDDNAVSQVGRWPWRREVTAEILDEIRLTGPKVLAMDILFAEPEDISYDKAGKPLDHDAILAQSIRQLNCVLAPSSFTFDPPAGGSRATRRLIALLADHPDLTAEQCVERLRQTTAATADLRAEVGRLLLSARPEAIYQRIGRELDAAPRTKAQIQRALFPQADAQFAGSVLDRLFDEEYERVVRERSLDRFTLEKPASSRLPPVLHAFDQITPILPVSEAAAYSAFANYLPDQAEGTVRAVPLLATYRGRLYPHMALATACAMLDVDIHTLQIRPDAVVIPRPGGRDIVIPVSTRENTSAGPVGLLMEIPLVGQTGGWQTMYDYPRHADVTQHVSVYEVWRVCLTRGRIAANEAAADQILTSALSLTDPAAAARYRAAPLRGAAQTAFINDALANMADVITGLASVPDLGAAEKILLQKLRLYDQELREIVKQNDALAAQLGQLRAELRDKLHGKAIFLGGTATGHVDMFPTSLHATCPGVVIHGAVFNAILTGKMWRVAPAWLTILLTIAVGLLAGLMTSALSPAKAFVGTAVLGAGYLAANGWLLFDYGNLIVGAAGPACAAALVWSAITVFDFITEVSERARITRRFRTYVDPSLVNWVINHPEQARFDGEAREMTMGFTDLAGFTTFTESLGERTVPLIAEYMGRMIPVIRAHKGYVSRLMGDGIYFFFGAPEPAEDHAIRAVDTAIGMHAALDELNLTLPQRGLPVLTMRAGLSTGRVIVGDAGSADFSDYTALGDSVNLGARLEAANKIFGTKMLITARTIELLDGQFLVRPIANLRVAGKTKGVKVYEALCRREAATGPQQEIASLTERMFDAFNRAAFEACLESAEQIERIFGETKLTALYRKLCVSHRIKTPDDFDGQIVLTEK